MPAKKYTKKKSVSRKRYNRKRTFRKRYVKKTRRTGIKPYVLPTIAPVRLMTKLNYEEILNISYAGTAECQFRTASLYDPQYALTGMNATGATNNGQPGFFDVLKNWYRAYIVRGCAVRFSINNNSQEIMHGQYIVTTTSDGPIANTYDWTSLRALVRGGFVQNYTANATRRKIYIDNYKVTGSSKTDALLTQNNLLTAVPGSNPGLSPYFQLSVKCADGSGTVSGILRLSITYYAEFFDRKMLVGADA